MANPFPYQPIAPGAFTPAFPGTPPTIGSVLPGGLGSLNAETVQSSSDELFAALLELRWRDVSIPYVRLHNRIRQDLVIHKFVDRDGAHIEAVGRHPIEVRARVPLLNGLQRGKNETWQRPLYPFTWGNLVRAVCDKTPGVLNHPELGPLTCKCETMEWELEAQVRSGVWVDLVWLESDDTGQNLAEDLASPSPLANCAAAAGDLDGLLATVKPTQWPQPYEPPISFSDLTNSFRGVVDTPTLLQKQLGGRIDNFIYEANAMGDSLRRADNAMNWPMTEACERAKSAAYDLKATLLTKNRSIALFKVLVDSTIAQVANDAGAPINDILVLNPAYVGQAVILRDSIVRYYKRAS